jgi:hypothetical protein
MQSQFKNFEDYLKYYHELKVNKEPATSHSQRFGHLA